MTKDLPLIERAIERVGAALVIVKVVREYIGSGALAEFAAELDAQRRQRRERTRAIQREECKRLDALMAPVEEFYEATEIITHSALIASGYRRHKRGEWRKTRE